MTSVVKSGESGLHVSLHPLPILNISEHLTRTSLQLNDPNVRIVGGLLGTQQGRDIEIMNTFEIVIGPEGVDHAYFVTRKEQFKQVFPSFDFLGWYSVGPEPSSEDITLHKQFFEYNETPLFLQLQRDNSRLTPGSKDLPVTIYESVVEIVNNAPEVLFVKATYEIETGEAERVAVDHVSKNVNTGNGNQSSLIANLTTQRNAIKMLFDRISVIVQYLQAVAAGSVSKDEETLRQISSLVTSWPATESDEFKNEFMTEYNDVLLTTYLAALTKQLATTNELLDKQLLLASGSNNSGNGGGGGGRGGVADRDMARGARRHQVLKSGSGDFFS